MKLKTKLVVAFMAVMILPTIFTMVAMYAIAPRKVGEIQQLYLLIVFMTAALLVYWIYRTVSVPLDKAAESRAEYQRGQSGF